MSSDQKIDASSLLVTTIKGVGEKLSQSFLRLGIKTVEDLLFHFPIGYQDRTKLKKIADLIPDEDFVIRGSVEKVSQTFVPRKMLLVKLKDNTGHIYIRFFYYFPGLRNIFKEGVELQISGTGRLGRYGLETVHPEYEVVTNKDFKPQILPRYSLTKGITHQKVRKIVQEAVNLIEEDKIHIPDYLPSNELDSLNKSIIDIHNPSPNSNINDYLIGGESAARKRIGLEEIVANKISYLSIKEQNKNRVASIFENNSLAKKILNSLPFELTDDQKNAYNEISKDLALGSPMLRLLQGDVGSGKTIIAALIAAKVVEANKQVAVLAPTTILANQHYQNFVNWFGDNTQVEILTSKISAKDRKIKYERILNGKAKIIIGTHQLFPLALTFG